MRIIGVDPGTLITGYGIIEYNDRSMKLVEFGTIRSDSSASMPLRLKKIYLELSSVVETYLPDQFAIESAFYSKNVQSTLKLGHARGVSILAAVLNEIPIAEYAPREVKQAVVGNGGASKEQVAYMVRALLGINHEDIPLDASDALAVAICHGSKMLRPTTRAKSWKEFIEEHPERVKKK